jgi:hypothetical protein
MQDRQQQCVMDCMVLSRVQLQTVHAQGISYLIHLMFACSRPALNGRPDKHNTDDKVL